MRAACERVGGKQRRSDPSTRGGATAIHAGDGTSCSRYFFMISTTRSSGSVGAKFPADLARHDQIAPTLTERLRQL
jgi:hypothetical protein